MTAATAERYVVTRTIAATPAEIFAVLGDPTRHKDTEPGDWVRDAIDTDRITATGQMFAVNMFLEQAGGHYVMHNLVTDFDEDRTRHSRSRRLVVAVRPRAERCGHRRHRHLRLERNVAGVPRHHRGARFRCGLHRGVAGDA